MRKLTLCENLSLDGVMQHTPDENGFPFPHWTMPYRTREGLDMLIAEYGDRYDLLLGRRTYDLWSEFWPNAPQSPMGDRLNAATKFIVTHHPDTLAWGPHTALPSGFAPAVRELKQQDGPDIILCGSSTLIPDLFAHGLVDEVLLVTVPVLLGTGKRFFQEGTPAHSLQLLRTQTSPTGVLINRYRVAEALQPA